MKRRGLLTKLLLGSLAAPSVAKALAAKEHGTIVHAKSGPIFINGVDPRWKSYDRIVGHDRNGTLVEEVVEHGTPSKTSFKRLVSITTDIKAWRPA